MAGNNLSVLLLEVIILVGYASSQLVSFTFLNGPPANTIGLQVDTSGNTFVSAGNTLYRLNSSLELKESLTLPTNIVNRGIALTGDQRKLVVCLTDLSCFVYNASTFTDGPLWNVSDAIVSTEYGVALFTSGDTFYTGSVTGAMGAHESGDRMAVNQFGKTFTRSSDLNGPPMDDYTYHSTNYISRQFYGGFVQGGYAYFIVADFHHQKNTKERAFRMLRVCNVPNCTNGVKTCGVSALYEASFTCGLSTLSNRAHVCGLSLLNNFGEKNETVAIVARCEEETNRNHVCLINITTVNKMMDGKFKSCSTAASTLYEETDIVWDDEFRCGNLQFDVSQVTSKDKL